MFKKFYHLVDFFLPEHLGEQVDISTLFRARAFTASGVLGILMMVVTFIGASLLTVPLIIKIGLLFALAVHLSLIIFVKTRTSRFEFFLNLGAGIQVFILYATVYFLSFIPQGIGFFSLVWLAPLTLASIFFFKPLYAFISFLINAIVLVAIYFYFHKSFYYPIENIPSFSEIYLLFLACSTLMCSFLALIFIHLNEVLKDEMIKQRGALVESAKFQSLGKMASNLAHDINNPLFTIQGKLHQIRNLFSHDELDLDKCDHIIEEVEATILRLSQLVKGISTFARQGDGDQMVSVSIDEILNGIVLLASDRIVQAGITFGIKIAPNTKVICYPSYVTQILINLLNNAIDALEHSEIKLIQIEAYSKDSWVEIHVKDSGPGVNPAIESKIFESFFTTKKMGKGTGLGLSISKGLVEIHEGDLRYQRVGNMTDFVVRFPSYE